MKKRKRKNAIVIPAPIKLSDLIALRILDGTWYPTKGTVWVDSRDRARAALHGMARLLGPRRN